MTPTHAAFLRYAATKLEENFAQVERCVGLLSASELWRRDNAHTNSVGNLLLHLTGNVRQWIVAGIAGEAFLRDRPAEFAARQQRPAAEILEPLRRTVQRAIDVIRHVDDAGLAIPRAIQGYHVLALVAIFHVVEHFSFHTGQIVHITKLLRDVDLSRYDAQGHKLAPRTASAAENSATDQP